MAEVYTRRIKAVSGDGTVSVKILTTPGKRVHSVQLQLLYAGGTNTLAALMTALTEIRCKVGTNVRWRINGTKLRDFVLLHGTTYDFNGLPNTGCQVTIPFAPEWLLENVADSLAWNPALLGGPISVELDSTTALTVIAYESISDDLDAPSSGIITLEVINPVAGGTDFYVKNPELDPRGRLLLASIYPDSTNANEITPASLMVGAADVFAHERLTSAQNDEQLERKGLTPAASGRTANIYDIVTVKGDQLNRGIDLGAWGKAVLRVEAAAAMAGVCSILLARLEAK